MSNLCGHGYGAVLHKCVLEFPPQVRPERVLCLACKGHSGLCLFDRRRAQKQRRVVLYAVFLHLARIVGILDVRKNQFWVEEYGVEVGEPPAELFRAYYLLKTPLQLFQREAGGSAGGGTTGVGGSGPPPNGD